jgi:hypothetical protein
LRFLIVSDTHGRYERLFKLIKKTGPYDGLIHCGDAQLSRKSLEQHIGCPLYIVKGNCDTDVNLPLREEIILEGHKILIVHGHRENVKWDLQNLWYTADEVNAEIVFYGHTHEIDSTHLGDHWFVNPGSLELPRGTKPSYAVMTLENGKLDIQIRFFK